MEKKYDFFIGIKSYNVYIICILVSGIKYVFFIRIKSYIYIYILFSKSQNNLFKYYFKNQVNKYDFN